MKFLAPIGGFDDPRFGILAAPRSSFGSIPKGIKSGLAWGADLGCLRGPEFVKRFEPDLVYPWLEKMREYLSSCLFVTVPDHVGDSRATLQDFLSYSFDPFPVAYVAQDGQEDLDFPPSDRWNTLFVGGSTKWKMSDAAISCIRRALGMGKGIHIGRVNYRIRYDHFRSLEGSERFTCDGTRIRYGRDLAIRDWIRYMDSPKQYGLFVSTGDRGSQLDNE